MALERSAADAKPCARAVSSKPSATSRQVGNATLARGLTALLAVAESPSGLTVQEVAKQLEVHRSIAYRTLQTLVDFGMASHNGQGVYRGGHRLAGLSSSYLPQLRELALPHMQQIADRARSAVILFVLENGMAIAVEEVRPTTATHMFTFRKGGRTLLDRGAAAYALLSLNPPQPDDAKEVRHARELGYSRSAGEVEPGAYGAAVPIVGVQPRACLMVMTHVSERVDLVVDDLLNAAREISASVDPAGPR